MPLKTWGLLILVCVQWNALSGQGLKSGLIANYPFSGNLIDYSPTANHGVNDGSILVTDYCGQASNALSCINNSAVIIPYKPATQIQPPLSYSFRVKFTTYSATVTYTLWVSNTNLQSDPGYAGMVVQYLNGEFYFHLKNGQGYASGGRRSYTVAKNLSLNQWHTVTVVIPNYNTCLVNIDCQNQTVNSNNTTVSSIFYSANGGAFGRTYYPPISATYYYNNQIDDFRLWNRALTPAEVNRICSSDTSYLTYETCNPHSFLGTLYPSPSVNIIPKGNCAGYYHLTLTVPAPDSLLVTDTLCAGQPYIFRGQTFVSPVDTLWSMSNCDTVFGIKLVEPIPDTTVYSASACNGSSYTFRNMSFPVPADTLLNGTTCDSILRLVVTGYPCDTLNIIDSLCENEAYVYNGQSYFAPTDIFMASASGDTVIHLQLFEKFPKYWVTANVYGCPDDVLDTLGNTFTFPFTYSLVYADCDSLLNLIGNISEDCNYDCKPFIPNSFTPNKDGVNDIFALGGGIGPFSLKIFNRWGQMVFQSDNYQNNWDGTYKERPVDDGVYTYVLECLYKNPYGSQSDPKGSVRVYTGTITIFR